MTPVANRLPPVRLIAFYLPQFHPIPENDRWWGKGFTEWTNVAKAKPLFRGHYQPHVPADLGFYDLRVPETRIAQAEMARDHGIEGFCYWHYWFAGKRLLERPFNEVLHSGEPDLPFCLAWANQSWTGVWHGSPETILIEQTYPGMEDYQAHFYALLEAFGEDRYLRIGGKAAFVIFSPYGLPDAKRFTDCWRDLAVRSGLDGMYFIAIAARSWPFEEHGFDAAIVDNLGAMLAGSRAQPLSRVDRICRKLTGKSTQDWRRRDRSIPVLYEYKDAIRGALLPLTDDANQFPCVIPNWDNTPRSGARGVVLHNSTPDLFRSHLCQAIAEVADRELDKRVIFVKSWNEWAEGNYLEPDQRFGKGYLEAIKDAVMAQATVRA